MSICIPKELFDEVEGIFKIKNSIEREKALNSFFDAETARKLNSRYEKTLSANKVNLAYKRFINDMTISPERKNEMILNAEKNKLRKEQLIKELEDAGQIKDREIQDIEDFANEIYKKKYNIEVTPEETKKVIELSNIVSETSKLPKLPNGDYDPSYGKAMYDLAEYTNQIKNKNKTKKFFGEGGKFQDETTGMNKTQKVIYLLDNAKKYVSSNTFKSMKATLDASYIGIQGSKGILSTSPRTFFESLKESFKVFKNPIEAMKAFRINLLSKRRYNEALEVGTRLIGKEEQFYGDVLEKVPGVKSLVSRADNAFTIFLQNARYKIYQIRADAMEKTLGRKLDISNDVDRKILEDIADFSNKMTGTSNLGKAEKYSPLINEVAFAGRYAVSDAKLYTDPVKNLIDWARIPMNSIENIALKQGKKEILKMNLTQLGINIGAGIGTYYLLSQVFPDNTEQRVNSSNWLRFNIGDKWYTSPVGSKGEWLWRLGGKLIAGSEISKDGKVYKYNDGYNSKTRGDAILRTLRSKAAPLPALAIDIFTGKDFTGKEITFLRALSNLTTPISAKDTVESGYEIIVNGETMEIPRWFIDSITNGMGITSYDE